MALPSSICCRIPVNTMKGRKQQNESWTYLTSRQPSRPRGCFLLLLLQLLLEIFDLTAISLDQCLCIDDLFLRCVQLEGKSRPINDQMTVTRLYAPYLNLLDPLCELERARRLYDGRGLGVYRANNRYSRVTGQGRLQHPRQLRVSERHMVTGPAPLSVKIPEQFLSGSITFCL